jgi:hypothetical protein
MLNEMLRVLQQLHEFLRKRLLAEPAALTTILLLVDLPLTTPPCCFSSLGVGPGGRSGSFLAREKMSLSALRRAKPA